jgi:hypothetical protein
MNVRSQQEDTTDLANLKYSGKPDVVSIPQPGTITSYTLGHKSQLESESTVMSVSRKRRCPFKKWTPVAAGAIILARVRRREDGRAGDALPLRSTCLPHHLFYFHLCHEATRSRTGKRRVNDQGRRRKPAGTRIQPGCQVGKRSSCWISSTSTVAADCHHRVFPNAAIRSKVDKKTYVGPDFEECTDFSGLNYRLPFEKVCGHPIVE